jgi:2-iminobutanoate/2-iminopropanoate deaminase
MPEEEGGSAPRASVRLDAAGDANVETGIPVLDHLLGLMAHYARLDVALEVEPGTASAEASAAGTALGDALRAHLGADAARGHVGIGSCRRALAHVALDVSDPPLFASNVDLAGTRWPLGRRHRRLPAQLCRGRRRPCVGCSKVTIRNTCRAIFKALARPSRRPAPRNQEGIVEKGRHSHRSAPTRSGRPCSQAIRAGGWCSSQQIALRPGGKELTGGTIAEQTEQVFANLRAILEEAGSGLDRIVKTTVFLKSFDDFAGMNEVYAKHIGGAPPARATVEVSKLPSDALVEIEAVALAS